MFQYEQRQLAELIEETAERYPQLTLRHAGSGFMVAALVFFATAVPEVVVTLSALHLGALDMAIGNLFGSSLFDLVIIAVDDQFFLRGPILSLVPQLHLAPAISAMMTNGVAIVGLLDRPATRLFRVVGWASLFVLVIYLLNSYALYLHGE